MDYISDEYGISKSSVWYNLNCLKEKGVIDFADKQHQGEPLMLTRKGMEQLGALASRRSAVLEAFSGRTGVGYAAEVPQHGMVYRVGVYPVGSCGWNRQAERPASYSFGWFGWEQHW